MTTRTHLKNPISATMTRFPAASRSSLLTIAKLFLVGLHGFRSKISHFATKAIFEMGSIFIKSAVYAIALSLLPRIAMGNETTYNLASPIPGSGTDQVTTISAYLKYLFPFLLSVAAISALVMFIRGAIQYMASGGNPSRAGEAKNIMTDAIIGLLLAVGSVLILRTINPALVELDLNIPSTN